MKKKIQALVLTLIVALSMFQGVTLANSDISNGNSSNVRPIVSVSGGGNFGVKVGDIVNFKLTVVLAPGYSEGRLTYSWYFIPNWSNGQESYSLVDGNGIIGSSTSQLSVTASAEKAGQYYALVTFADMDEMNSNYMSLSIVSVVPDNIPQTTSTPYPVQTTAPTQYPSNNNNNETTKPTEYPGYNTGDQDPVTKPTQYPGYNMGNQDPVTKPTQYPGYGSGNQSTATPLPTGNLPGAPNPRVIASEDSISVDWLQPDDGGSILRAYFIRLNNQPHPRIVFFTPYGSSITYFRGLQPGTEYTIELWAENGVGRGPSAIRSITTWGTAPAATSEPSSPSKTEASAPAPLKAALRPEPSFSDVPPDAWYGKDLKAAYQLGLVNGSSDTTYSPENDISFAELIKLAACMHQLYVNGEVTLAPGSEVWYSTFVDYALEKGIITKTYDYDKKATRAEYMDIFSRALPEGALPAVNSIPDDAIPDIKISHPYSPAIYKLYRAGIVRGSDEKGSCKPDSTITRAEVAAILTRMIDPSARVSFSLN